MNKSFIPFLSFLRNFLVNVERVPVHRYGHQVQNRSCTTKYVTGGPHVAQLGAQDPPLADLQQQDHTESLLSI